MISAQGFELIEGGICAPEGFKANGLNCGFNPDKEKYDLALIMADKECDAAAVYTQNRVKGAPIIVTQENLKLTGNKVRAVIANSKNANTCNSDGIEKAKGMCDLAAKALGIDPSMVAVASTGVIGERMDIEPVREHIDELAKGLTYDGGTRAEYAIMTTDTVKKEVAYSFSLGGRTCHIGGMAKGSGMIHPNMATTLNFITTDVAIDQALMQKALSEIVKTTYNCLSVDGDTSTNDMILVMTNGEAGNEVIKEDGGYTGDDLYDIYKSFAAFDYDKSAYNIIKNEELSDYGVFYRALWLVLLNLTRMLAEDGEGAGKLISCEVSGAKDRASAIAAAKSVIASELVKCAMFGEDANCGRIMCALGYADGDIDTSKTDLDLCSAVGSMPSYRGGFALDFDEDLAAKILKEDEIIVRVNLNDGDAFAVAWGCDMTYDYVKINGDYRS
ncbi:MAG: bifunctional ornithine acetyltransferase/N-acetylglutamate synthase [Lachnospiraceae bacterium]|nr:bifunctional ornithine acetyltransferase/N-acetylglutamate synthase [Lachnospiraceae bacterium]